MAKEKKSFPRRRRKDFSIGEAIQKGWNLAAQNVSTLILALLITLAIGAVFGGVQGLCNMLLTASIGSTSDVKWVLIVIMAFAFMVVFLLRVAIEIWVQSGLFIITLKLATDREARLKDLFPTFNNVWRYFLGGFMLGLIVLAGLILLIIPGIVWGIKYQYVPYLMVDKRLTISSAFETSAQMTNGLKWKLFLYDFCLLGVALLGLAACCIGVLWSGVIVQIATAFVYQTLLLQTNRSLALKKVS